MRARLDATSPQSSDVAWTVAATLLSGALQLLLLAFLARVLTPAELGLIAIANVVIAFALLMSDCGISNFVIYARTLSTLQQSSLYWFSLCLGLFAGIIVALVAPLLARFYAAPELDLLLYLAAAIFPVFTAGAQFQAQLSKRLLLGRVARIEMLSRCVAFSSAVLLASTGFGASSFVLGQLAGAAVRSLAMFMVCRGYWRPRPEFDPRALKPALRFAGFNTSGQLINRLAADIDVLLIGRLLDVGSLGIYSLAKELAFGILRLLTTVTSRVGIPMLAALQADADALTRDFTRLLDVVSASAATLFAALILLSPWLIPQLYGESYEEVTLVFSLLSVIACLRSLGSVHGVLIVATGRVHLDLAWNLLVVAITTPAIYLAALEGLDAVLFVMLAAQMTLYVAAYPLLLRGAVSMSFVRFLGQFAVAFALTHAAVIIAQTFRGPG
ncbi:MOP flippase family protein [Pseudohaliea sp.]|uniref:MOP flippase family protein n=1 Tax=Pseudohaliea sp. TaxID=2740289 RepID=UPI0032EEEA7F